MTDIPSLLSSTVPVLGPLSIVAGWLLFGRDRARRGDMTKLWLGALLATGVVGWLVGAGDPDVTRRALAIFYSSPSWLLGPALLPLVGRVHALVGFGVGAVVAPAGVVVGFIAAIFTGVVNPCG